MNRPIPPAFRAESSRRLAALTGPNQKQSRLNTNVNFALAPNGAVDDRTALGPFLRPATITSITYISDLAALSTRNLALLISTDDNTATADPNRRNVIDPRSPTQRFVPGVDAMTVRIGIDVMLRRWWFILERAKNGSATFGVSVWITLSELV